MGEAPFTNPFFRPEEKHIISGENNVVPPPGGWNKTMENPATWRRTFQANLQIERLTGLRAARLNSPGTPQCSRYPERIPCTISEILRVIDDHHMLRRDTGKGRSHPNGFAIGLQHQYSLST